MASERALAAATRSESQDFIPETYFDVIFSDKESVPGDIVDLSGKKLGVHRGIEHYTIGQRRGLGVSSNKPLYVHSIDTEKNQVVLSDNDALLCAGLVAEDWVWAGNYWPEKSFEAQVKIRLASPATEAEIIPQGDGSYKIMFKYPQRASLKTCCHCLTLVLSFMRWRNLSTPGPNCAESYQQNSSKLIRAISFELKILIPNLL